MGKAIALRAPAKLIADDNWREGSGTAIALTCGTAPPKVLYPSEKPWCICRLGADAQNRIIRRYANRQDADDDLRQVTRWLNDGGQYVVAFDVVEAPPQF